MGWGAPFRKRAAQARLGPVLEPPQTPGVCPVTLSQGADLPLEALFLICVLGAETPTVHDQRMLTTAGHQIGPQKSCPQLRPQPPAPSFPWDIPITSDLEVRAFSPSA